MQSISQKSIAAAGNPFEVRGPVYWSIPGPVGSTWYTIIYMILMESVLVLAVAMERSHAFEPDASTIDNTEVAALPGVIA